MYIILAGILWGTSGLFVNFLSPLGLSSIQITAVRSATAAICMAFYVFLYNKSLFKATKKEILLYICSGVSIFLTSSCYFFSIQASSVATAVVLMYTAPVFVMIYSVLFLNEKFTREKFVALILVMIGSCFVSGVIGNFKYSTIGIIFGFLSGIAYSMYNIFTKIQMRKNCNAISASMYSFIFMFAAALLVSKPLAIIDVAVLNPESIIIMILCGVCTGALPYFLYTLALKYLPAGTASALGIVEPMAATVFSIMFLKESLNIYMLLGIVLILTAVFILSRSKQ